MRKACLLALAMACSATWVQADSVALSSINRGWYTASGARDNGQQNYMAGVLHGATYHDFFLFDLTQTQEAITGAQLLIFNPKDGFGGASSGDVSLFDVSTTAADLTKLSQSISGAQAIYNDLGSGTSFGSRTITPADDNRYLIIDLNDAFVSLLNARQGDLVALGGVLSGGGYSFGFTSKTSGPAQLLLTTQTPRPQSPDGDGQVAGAPVAVPLPSALSSGAVLLGAMFVFSAARRRTRSHRYDWGQAGRA